MTGLSLATVNPIPVREFEVYAQQNAASRFQLPIDREKYDESGLTTELIELKKITDS
jgi:hypothetical protein